MWWGLFKKSFKESTPKVGSIKGRTGRKPKIQCPPNINCRRGSRRPLEWQNRADKKERCRWRFKSPNVSSKSPPYKAKSEGGEVKRKVGEGGGGGGGGDLDPSNLVDKKRRKWKINWKNEKKRKRKQATQPRSDHLWSRSPSHGGEGRSHSPEHGGERFGFKGLGSLWKVLGKSRVGLLKGIVVVLGFVSSTYEVVLMCFFNYLSFFIGPSGYITWILYSHIIGDMRQIRKDNKKK